MEWGSLPVGPRRRLSTPLQRQVACVQARRNGNARNNRVCGEHVKRQWWAGRLASCNSSKKFEAEDGAHTLCTVFRQRRMHVAPYRTSAAAIDSRESSALAVALMALILAYARGLVQGQGHSPPSNAPRLCTAPGAALTTAAMHLRSRKTIQAHLAVRTAARTAKKK